MNKRIIKQLKDMIGKFVKEYRIISILLLICIAINISYAVTYYMPDYFGIEGWYSLINNISISYVAAFIFFIFQVYIPQKQKEKKSFSILENDLRKVIDDVDLLCRFVLLLSDLDGDEINLKCDNLDEPIYYKIKRNKGAPIIQHDDARQKLQSYEKTILNKIENIKNNSQFSFLGDELIVVLSELQVELGKNKIKDMGIMAGISVCVTIQGIAEECANLSKQLQYLEIMVGYSGYIDTLELLSQEEIQNIKDSVAPYQALSRELDTKIHNNRRV